MVRWHMDDLMISRTSNEAISQFLRVLKDIYGDNLAENTGKVHDYLGMIFDFLTPKSVTAGTKNFRSEGFWLAKLKHTNIPTMMVLFSPPSA